MWSRTLAGGGLPPATKKEEEEEATMLRRVSVLTAGLAMTAGVGLLGVGTASAVSPELHIKPGAQWTFFPMGGGCEVDTFNTTTNTFTSDHDGDEGTWTGGGLTIKMMWTAGPEKRSTFKGSFMKASKTAVYYTGTFTYHHFHFPGSDLNKGVFKGC
jgi:hypothetical protein